MAAFLDVYLNCFSFYLKNHTICFQLIIRFAESRYNKSRDLMFLLQVFHRILDLV